MFLNKIYLVVLAVFFIFSLISSSYTHAMRTDEDEEKSKKRPSASFTAYPFAEQFLVTSSEVKKPKSSLHPAIEFLNGLSMPIEIYIDKPPLTIRWNSDLKSFPHEPEFSEEQQKKRTLIKYQLKSMKIPEKSIVDPYSYSHIIPQYNYAQLLGLVGDYKGSLWWFDRVYHDLKQIPPKKRPIDLTSFLFSAFDITVIGDHLVWAKFYARKMVNDVYGNVALFEFFVFNKRYNEARQYFEDLVRTGQEDTVLNEFLYATDDLNAHVKEGLFPDNEEAREFIKLATKHGWTEFES